MPFEDWLAETIPSGRYAAPQHCQAPDMNVDHRFRRAGRLDRLANAFVRKRIATRRWQSAVIPRRLTEIRLYRSRIPSSKPSSLTTSILRGESKTSEVFNESYQSKAADLVWRSMCSSRTGHPTRPIRPQPREPAGDARAGLGFTTTRELAKRACFDCHSNETEWPAYASIAPVSWLVQRDVTEGRRVLNFSEWHRAQDGAKDASEEVRQREMPPATYRFVHAHARLSAADVERLVNGLMKTMDAVAAKAQHEREH